jgi:hypothetical protein
MMSNANNKSTPLSKSSCIYIWLSTNINIAN